MRQLTGSLFGGVITQFSKLPIRQLTPNVLEDILIPLSKLPIRQLTEYESYRKQCYFF